MKPEAQEHILTVSDADLRARANRVYEIITDRYEFALIASFIGASNQDMGYFSRKQIGDILAKYGV